MRKFKQTLSFVLALCLLLSVLPVTAFALTVTSKPADGTTVGQPFLTGTGGSTNFRIPGLVTLDNGTLIASSDARWNHTGDGAGLDTIVSVSTDNGANWTYTYANYLGDNGNTYNNLSTCIIDPAIGTDGETAYLIADLFPAGIALNTSRYSPIAGENGFDDDGHLLLRDLAGDTVAIGTDGYNTMAAAREYNYYLDLDTRKLYEYGAEGDTEITGLTVDAWFNITGTDAAGDSVDTNLFFADSPYQPYPTDYLYLVTSTDGLAWSAPKLLNLQEEDEQVLLIGPGNGTYDAENDRMIFTAYEYTGGYQRACLLWADSEGNWYRTEDATVDTWSSEASVVVLPNGNPRIFFRDGYSILRYTDYVWDAEAQNYVRDANATEVTTEAAKRGSNGCQLSAIRYSGKIEDKDAILVSCAGNPDARSDGYLYVFLLNDDNTMELAYAYDIIPGQTEYYAYSCISQMRNGDIALVYEGDYAATSGSGEIIFTTIDMDDVTVYENDARLNFLDVALYVGDTFTLKDTTGHYDAASSYDATVAQVTVSGKTAAVPAAITMESGDYVALEDAMYTLTAVEGGWNLSHTLSDGTVVYIDAHGGSGNYGYPNKTAPSLLTFLDGTASGTIQIKDDTGSLHLHKELEAPYWNQCSNPCGYKHDLLFFRAARDGETESDVFAGFVQVSGASALADGEQYLIAATVDTGDDYYVLTPTDKNTSATCNDHLAVFSGDAEVSATTVTIRGLKAGQTSFQVGANVYRVQVSEIPAEELTVKATYSTSFTLEGAYDASDVTGLDTRYATVALEASGDTVVYGQLRDSSNSGTRVTLADSEYTFADAGSGAWYATIAKDGTTWYVRPNAKGHSANQTALTITFHDDGTVYIKDASHYLYVNRNTLAWDRVGTTGGYESHITFCLFTQGEDADSPIPGYKQITAAEDIAEKCLIAFYGSDGQLYVMNPTTRSASAYNQMAAVVTELENAVTQVTVTGVAEGTTAMTLAGKKYNITVLSANYDPIAIPEAENVYQGPALTITEKPANGTTTGQPFPAGTGGSQNFRIPGIVTLDNGTVIASTDARWNHTGDGAGLDTLLSVSTDNGANWTYTFANYMGDNGNVKNNLSTSIIDPAIGTDGTTAYLIADLFPAGIALNTSRYAPVAGENGFDENGNLLLRDLAGDTVIIGDSGYNTMAAARTYNYYLDLQTLKICTANGTVCEDFTVDAWFNIRYTDAAGVTHSTNLFYADSPFQPYPTDYLYLVTSADGLTWSAPKLLNLQEDAEQTLLIGPGNGTYDAENDRMIFTAYEYTSGTERTSLIWEDSDGTWHRTADATSGEKSSEASVVVLPDGTLRVFYRDLVNVLRYTDYVWSDAEDNYVVENMAVATTADKTLNNQLSAIFYSGKLDGRDAILVSTAVTNSATRRNGHIYVFALNADNSMELAYSYDVVEGDDDYFAYSCISELKNGSIGLLYEADDGGRGTGVLDYQVIPMADIACRDNDVRLRFVDVTVLTGETAAFTDPSGDYTGSDTTELNEEIAGLTMSAESETDCSATLGSDASYSGGETNLASALYAFTINAEGRWSASAASGTVYLYPGNTTSSGYPNRTAAYSNLTIRPGYEDGSCYIMANDCDHGNQNTSYLYFDRTNLRWDRVSDLGTNTTWMTNCSMYLYRKAAGAGSSEIPGYERVTDIENLGEGSYLVAAPAGGSWYVLYPNTSTANRYCQIAKVGSGVTSHTTTLTFEGVAVGSTEVQIGSTVYRITVRDYDEVELTVAAGSSVSVEDSSAGTISGLDTTYATAAYTDGVLTVTGVYPGTASLILGRTRYTITVTGDIIDVALDEGQQVTHVLGSAPESFTEPDASVATTVFGTGTGLQLGSAAGVYQGGYRALEKALYTFAANDNGTWTVSGTADDGTTVYLKPYASTNGYPHSKSAVDVTLADGSTEDSVYISDSDGYLHFYRDRNYYFDRVTTTSGFEAATSFHLYRPAAEGETGSQEIPGFVRVEGVEAVSEGRYLIVAIAGSDYYVAYPSLSTAHRSAQIAKVVSTAPVVTITAQQAGTTRFRAASTVFDVTVSEHLVSIDQVRVVLGNELKMEFAFYADPAVDWTGAYAVATKSWADGRADTTYEIPASEWKTVTIEDKLCWYFTFDKIAAKEMMDEISVVLYSADGDAISTEKTDSVAAYLGRFLNGEWEDSLKRLAADMLVYGAKAQEALGYNTGSPATDVMADAHWDYVSTSLAACSDSRVKGENYQGSRLVLESSIRFQFAFRGLRDDMYAIVEYTTHGGTPVSKRIAPVEVNGVLIIDVSVLAVAEGRVPVTVTVCNADGTVYGSVTDSMESYAARSGAGGDNIYTAIMKLSDSAYAYFHPTAAE